jgi:hypothetical protein
MALRRTSFEPILTHQIGTLIGTTVSVFLCMVSIDEWVILSILATPERFITEHLHDRYILWTTAEPLEISLFTTAPEQTKSSAASRI